MKKLSIFAPLIGIFLITLGAVSCSAMVDDLKNMKGEVPYTVQHYFEAVDSDDFILDESKDLVLKGITGKNTEVTPEAIKGFTVKEVKNTKITSDGTAVAEVYYTRNEITVTFDANGGVWGSVMKPKTQTGKFGATFTVPDNPEKIDWNFLEWDILPKTGIYTFPAEDTTYTALWTQTGARYTVKHYLEVLDPEDKGEDFVYDEDNDLYYKFYRYQIQAGKFNGEAVLADEDDEPDAGDIPDYYTKARAFVLDGFTSAEIEQKEIKADGSTVVTVLYNRKITSVVFNPENGTWNDNETDVKKLEGKFESAVDKTVLDTDEFKLTREDYEFEGWDPEVPDTFPAFNEAVNAKWKLVKAPYTVKYFFETVEQTDSDDFTKYVEDETLRTTLKGTIGEKTQAAAKYAAGFSRVDFAQADITADGKTVVNIYYKRNIIELTLKAGTNGKWSDNSVEKTISGKYGAPVPTVISPENTDSDFEFVGWNVAGGILPLTYPLPDTDSSNTVYTAIYAQDTASYIVRHLFEPVDCTDSNDNTQFVEDAAYRVSLKGQINADTNAVAVEKTGFTPKTFSQVKIAASGTEVKIYYTRNTVEYTFLAEGGKWSDDSTEKKVSGKFGTAVTAPDTTDLTYITEDSTFTFTGWSPSVPAVYGAVAATYKAQWQIHNASYQLFIYVQQEENKDPVLETTLKKKGAVGEWTADEVEERPGYEAFYDKAKVLQDGSARARIRYMLKKIKYTYEPNGGKWVVDDSTEAKIKEGYYTSKVVLPTASELSKEDYTLSGWTPVVPVTYGTDDATYTAVWQKHRATYSVKHYLENLDGTTEMLIKSDTAKGVIGTKTTANADSSIIGFTPEGFEQVNIAEDDSTVVEIHYKRNVVTINLDPNLGHWTDTGKDTSKEITGKYGAAVGDYGTVYRDDYAFGGWELNSSAATLGSATAVPVTFPANDMNFKAIWNFIGTDYYVTYKFQKLDGTYTNKVSEINAMIGEDITKLADENGHAFEQGKTNTSIKINGYANTDTNAAQLEKLIRGFKLVTIVQVPVSPDRNDPTVVEVFYDREEITLSFDANGGKWTDQESNTIKTVKDLYGKTVTAPSTSNLSREDYEFTGWDKTVPATFPSSNETYKANWNQVSAKYTVKYFFENLEGNYVEDAAKTVVETGTLNAQTTVTADTVEGFNAPVITQATIASDNSAVVEVKYQRKTITLTLDLNGGVWKTANPPADNKVSGKYGANVPAIGDVGRDDYSFAGWNPVIPGTFPAADHEYEAQWTYTGTNYKVEYWFEKTDGTYEKKEASYPTLTKTGTSGSDTQAEYLTSTEPGFVATTITQKKINADGSTVVEVKYDRMEVTLTFNANGGTLTGNTTATGKYGTAVTKPANPTRENWVFKGWGTVGGTIPDTFPYASVTYAAVWEQTGAEYTVKYYYQNIEDDEYTEKASQRKTLTGSINTTTTVTADAVEGFNAAVITQATVAADGSAVVQVKYARKTITLNLAANGGVLSGGVATISGKFGAAVTHPADPTRADYVFAGWSPSIPDTFPAVPEASYAAQWSQNAAAYTVKYFYQNTTGSDYTENESQRKTFKGTIGQTTNVSASAVDGFEAPVVTQATIVANGSAVVQVKFNRKEITITLNANGGTLAGSSEIKGRFGAAVTQPGNPTREDYRFDGWDITGGTLPSTFPDEDSEYTAKWVQTQAYYKVNHWIQQKDNTYVAIEDQVKGTIGETTDVAAVTNQPGFTAKPFEQKVIQASGTVVDIYYDRDKVTITFDVNGGYWTEDSSTANKVWANKVFQDTFENPGEVARNDYVFDGWSPALDAEYPSADKTYTATWTYIGTNYKVQYRFENTSGTFVVDESKTVTKNAKAGEQTQAVGLTTVPDGFSLKPIVQTAIAADGSTVVNVDYERNSVTLTFAANGGVLTGSASVSGKYGTAVTKPANPTREDYAFTGWNSAGGTIPDTFPSANATYTAQWRMVNATYSIVTKVQETDGSYTEESNTSAKGSVGSTTTVTAPDRTGFNKTITQATITENGAAVVTVQFSRKTITYTFAPNGGTWSVSNTASGLYGATVKVPDVTKLTKAGWVFKQWDKTVPAQFGESDETFTAQWTSGITGAGTNTAGSDIVLSHENGTFSVTPAYTGSWTYRWYIDGKLDSNLVTQSVHPTLTSGVHTIMVVAVENGMVSFTDSVTVKIN